MWMTNQDKSLFRYLYENKVATAQQIQRDIYCGYSLRSVNNRLCKLIKKKYVQTLPQLKHPPGKIYASRFYVFFAFSKSPFL